jgi:hypothetical protein
MRQARRWFRTGLEFCCVFVLVAVVLPCVALAFFLLRGALLVAGLVAIVGGVVLHCVSPRFRCWVCGAVERIGLSDPADASRAGSRM